MALEIVSDIDEDLVTLNSVLAFDNKVKESENAFGNMAVNISYPDYMAFDEEGVVTFFEMVTLTLTVTFDF